MAHSSQPSVILRFIQTITALYLLSLLLVGCTLSTDETISVEQLPSISNDNKAAITPELASEAPRVIAVLPFNNETGDAAAPDILRTTIQNHLSSKNFLITSYSEVEQLVESSPSMSPGQAAQSLGVDAVVTGNITDVELLHAGVYAQIELGVTLAMVDRNDRIIWQEQRSVTSRAGGVSTSPWGLLLNAAFATLHLTEKNLLAAADELGRDFAAAIPSPPVAPGARSKPYISNVLHDGANKVLNYGDTLTVGVKGDPGLSAMVAIEGLGSFSLREQEPGVYIQEIPVDRSWNAQKVSVTGRLIKPEGTAASWLSPAGLLTFDNSAPPAPTDLRVTTLNNKSTIAWEGSQDATHYRVELLNREEPDVLGETTTDSLATIDLPLFLPITIAVRASDSAENWSEPAVLKTTLLPVPGVSDAPLAPSVIKSSRKGSLLFSKRNSPFKIEGQVVIGPDDILFVEPGVDLQMGPQSEFIIEGESYFWGKPEAITLSSAAGQAPAQFITLATTKTAEFKGVTVRNGNQAIVVTKGQPTFSEVQFEQNAYSAAVIKGSAAPVFANCTFSGSMAAALVASDYAKVLIDGGAFTDNAPFHIQSSSVYPITTRNTQWQPGHSTSTVLGEVTYD